VMLERRKLLRETDSQRTPNGILRVYEHRKTGEVYLIRDPDIPLSEVESVQNEVIVLLENNGRLPEPVLEEHSDDPAISDDTVPAETLDVMPCDDMEPEEAPEAPEE